MHHLNNSLRFSASDLVGHLDCHHLTALDAAVARGSITKPRIWDPVLQTLVERGWPAKLQSLCTSIAAVTAAEHDSGAQDARTVAMYEPEERFV
jgi:hypothetical protein